MPSCQLCSPSSSSSASLYSNIIVVVIVVVVVVIVMALCAHSECSYTQAAPGLKKCSLRIHLCAWALKCPLHVSETTRKYDAFAEVCKNCTWNKYEPSWGRGPGSSRGGSWAHTTMGDTGNNTTQWQGKGPQNIVCALSL